MPEKREGARSFEGNNCVRGVGQNRGGFGPGRAGLAKAWVSPPEAMSWEARRNGQDRDRCWPGRGADGTREGEDGVSIGADWGGLTDTGGGSAGKARSPGGPPTTGAGVAAGAYGCGLTAFAGPESTAVDPP
jgi:hypothetical protein